MFTVEGEEMHSNTKIAIILLTLPFVAAVKEHSAMTPEQELALREFAEGIQRAITEGLEQALRPPALTWQAPQVPLNFTVKG